MTPLELLAAKVRGADSNADGARIIEKWYDEQIKHANNLTLESARIMQEHASADDSLMGGMITQAANNFATVSKLLELKQGGESENNDNGEPQSR